MSKLIRPAAAPLAQAAAWGSIAQRAVLRQDIPLAVDLAERAMTDRAELVRRVDAWERVAKGWPGPVTGELSGVDLSPRVDWRRDDGPLPEHDEPFLVVRMRWPGGEAAYGELDRAVGRADDAMQIEARILEMGTLSRAFAASHGLARSVLRLRLANADGALNWMLRDPRESIFQVRVDILIGFRSLPPRLYRPMGSGWVIARVESIEADALTVELRDNAEGKLGSIVPLPTVGVLRPLIRAAIEIELAGFSELDPAWAQRLVSALCPYDGGEVDKEVVRVPMARELVPLIRIGMVKGARLDQPDDDDKRHWGSGYVSAVAAYVVGASLRAGAAPARADLVEEIDRDPDDGKHRMRLYRYFGPASGHHEILRRGWRAHDGMVQRPSAGVRARLRRIGMQFEGRSWWVWILVIGAQLGKDEAQNRRATTWVVEELFPATIYAQFPEGAEGGPGAHAEWWAGRHDPAAIAAEIISRYSRPVPGQIAGSEIDAHSFRTASDSSVHRTWTTGVAGEITAGELCADVLDALGRSHEIDWWVATDGRLRARPAAITEHDLKEAIPAARHIDARHDIVRGSWRERVPLASDRWGLVTAWRIVGEKPDSLGFRPDSVAEEQRRAWGHILEGDADVSWWDRTRPGMAIHGRDRSRVELERFVHVCSFRVGLQGLAWELGDWLRVTHWAGVAADGGYRDRLVRIEGLALDWRSRQVQVTAVDFGYLEDEGRNWPGLLDDERHWERLRRDKPDGATKVVTTAGSVVAQLVGPTWERSGVSAGDLLRLPAEDGYGEMVRQITAVVPGTGGIQITLDEPMGASRVVETMVVERSHADPPSDAEWPGRYPVSARPFIRAADEETGSLPDGSPAYRYQG